MIVSIKSSLNKLRLGAVGIRISYLIVHLIVYIAEITHTGVFITISRY